MKPSSVLVALAVLMPLPGMAAEPPFACPENLPDDMARMTALRAYMDWMREHHPDWTIGQVAEHRARMLIEHGCAAAPRQSGEQKARPR